MPITADWLFQNHTAQQVTIQLLAHALSSSEDIGPNLDDAAEIEGLALARPPLDGMPHTPTQGSPTERVVLQRAEQEKQADMRHKLQKYLYTLADMHYEAAESVEFESVCIYRHCMDYSSSYSYTLEKNENDWYFSFDAVIDSSGVHTEVEKQRIDEHNAGNTQNHKRTAAGCKGQTV